MGIHQGSGFLRHDISHLEANRSSGNYFALVKTLIFCFVLFLWVFVGNTGVWTLGLTLARQAFYHLSHASSPGFCFWITKLNSNSCKENEICWVPSWRRGKSTTGSSDMPGLSQAASQVMVSLSAQDYFLQIRMSLTATGSHWTHQSQHNEFLPPKWDRIWGKEFDWYCLYHMPIPGPIIIQMKGIS
jgi:hypothetical protein